MDWKFSPGKTVCLYFAMKPLQQPTHFESLNTDPCGYTNEPSEKLVTNQITRFLK